MDPLTIIAYALQALELVPKVISAGQDISGYIGKVTGTINTANDTQTKIPDAAWDEVKAIREGLQSRLHG